MRPSAHVKVIAGPFKGKTGTLVKTEGWDYLIRTDGGTIRVNRNQAVEDTYSFAEGRESKCESSSQ